MTGIAEIFHPRLRCLFVFREKKESDYVGGRIRLSAVHHLTCESREDWQEEVLALYQGIA